MMGQYFLQSYAITRVEYYQEPKKEVDDDFKSEEPKYRVTGEPINYCKDKEKLSPKHNRVAFVVKRLQVTRYWFKKDYYEFIAVSIFDSYEKAKQFINDLSVCDLTSGRTEYYNYRGYETTYQELTCEYKTDHINR